MGLLWSNKTTEASDPEGKQEGGFCNDFTWIAIKTLHSKADT